MALAINDIFAYVFRKNYANLVKQCGGTLEAEMLVCRHTGLQPSEFRGMSISERMAYLKKALLVQKSGADSADNPKLFPKGPLDDLALMEFVVALDAEKEKPTSEQRGQGKIAETIATKHDINADSLQRELRRKKESGHVTV